MALSIAILGTRGIPNNYGGFEQIAGYLSKGLVEKGHDVTVYNSHRHPYKKHNWNGVNLIRCFDPEYLIGTAGQFVYDLNCILDTRKKNFDIILMLGYTSSSIWRSLYPKNAIVITNMDGLEWNRPKYSALVRRFLLYAEKLAIHSNGFFITDSIAIKEYLDNKYDINSTYIPYGAEIIHSTNEEVLSDYNLTSRDYYLCIARLEPENNIEVILDGFVQTRSDKSFIVIGNTDNRHGQYLLHKYKHDKRVGFIGPLFNNSILHTLISNCSIYFHGHSVGGTNPSLLEAMAGKALIAAHNNPFNRAVIGSDALFFNNSDDIRSIIKHNRNFGKQQVMINNNFLKIQQKYSWHLIVNYYEQFFYECYSLKKEQPIIPRQYVIEQSRA